MSNDGGLEILFIVFLIIFAIACVATTFITVEKDITVVEKVPVDRYKIIDSDDNMYIMQDIWFFGIFDTGNRYAKIKVNHTYHVKTSGIRFTVLSWYPNIIELKDITNSTLSTP